MYREWDRDFRRCEFNCRTAVSHLKKGTLCKWYKEKIDNIKSYGQTILSGFHNPTIVHQLPDGEMNLTIASDLVSMERRNGETRNYNIVFKTPRIADIVASLQEQHDWARSWETLDIYFRSSETRVAAGKRFQKMFLEKFRKQDPDMMPPCYELCKSIGGHLQSPLKAVEAVMPWKGLAQQPTLEYASLGKDADGSLYSKKELKAVIDAAMDKESPPIRFLIPCGQNWASWDTAVVVCTGEGKRAAHVILLQMSINLEQEIYSKGLNQVRDAIPANLNGMFTITMFWLFW